MALNGKRMFRGLDVALSLENLAEETPATTNEFSDLLLTTESRYAPREPTTGLDGGHEAMSSTRGLPPSTKSATGVDRGDTEDSPDMNEGEKLRQLLNIKRYEQASLAKAGGVTKAAVGKWLKVKRFSNRQWPGVRDALLKLGLNPADIRPSAEDQSATEDLTKLVERWSREQLTALRRIMTSDAASRERLLAYIEGALRHFPE